MITSRVSPSRKLYGLPGMPCSPGGSSAAGSGSCLTWCVERQMHKKSNMNMYEQSSDLTYSVSPPNAVVTERVLPSNLQCS